MTDTQDHALLELKPTGKPQVIELLQRAGLDVEDWKNYGNGDKPPGANPKYCYRWSFINEQVVVLNIWYDKCYVDKIGIYQSFNLRNDQKILNGPAKARAVQFDEAVKYCFANRIRPRIIILDRRNKTEGPAYGRFLDPLPWAVSEYNISTGDATIRRNAIPTNAASVEDDEDVYSEGELGWRLSKHRKRENKLRAAKIEDHKKRNNGRLPCEVPQCRFDFEQVYGRLGAEYAHVHHLMPLSAVDEHGVGNCLSDVAVICANCHAMIHRMGACLPLSEISVCMEPACSPRS